MTTSAKSLKKGHIKWIASMIALDVILLWACAVPDLFESVTDVKRAAIRLTIASTIAPLVLLLSRLLSSEMKASIVFWRTKHVLPGHRAFTVHAKADPRIDFAALEKNVGKLPIDAEEQNSRWYSLYKQVETKPAVWDSHSHFLLFRDMAAISTLLVPVTPICLWLLGSSTTLITASGGLLLGQYLLSMLAARQCSVRFITSVLAEHIAKKPTAPRKPRTKKVTETNVTPA